MAYTHLTTSPANIALARSLGATGLHVGILEALPTAMLFMQFVAAGFVNTLRYRRRLWIGVSIAQRLVLLPAALGVALVPGLSDQTWSWIVIAAATLNHGLLHFGTPRSYLKVDEPPVTHLSPDRGRMCPDPALQNLALDLPGVRGAFYRLPPFALPHKRFVTVVFGDRSQAFLGSNQSYRDSVRPGGRTLVYDDRQDEALARRGAALSPSTVWRWLSWLGDHDERISRSHMGDSTQHRQLRLGWRGGG